MRGSIRATVAERSGARQWDEAETNIVKKKTKDDWETRLIISLRGRVRDNKSQSHNTLGRKNEEERGSERRPLCCVSGED